MKIANGLINKVAPFIDSSVALVKNRRVDTARQIPPEVVDIILAYVAKPYIPIESTQKLFLLMRINSTFLNRVKIILKNDDVNVNWNRDKDFIGKVEKSLKWKKHIKYLSKVKQRKWCDHSVDAIVKNRILHPNQLVYEVKRILERVRHIKLSLAYMTPVGRHAILDSLSKRTDLKSLDLCVGCESRFVKQKYAEAVIEILNKNTALVEIPYLGFVGTTFNIEKLDTLMGALLNKKVGALSFDIIRINEKILKKCSENLKRLDVNYLSINSAALSREGMKILIVNLPRNLKKLSLKADNIDKDMAKFIFENLQDTEVEYIYLSKNNLSGFQTDDLRKISEHLSVKEMHLYHCGLCYKQYDFAGMLNKNKKEIEFFFEI